MCYIALVRCVLVLRCGSAGWCGILMQAEALLQPVNSEIIKQVISSWSIFIQDTKYFSNFVGIECKELHELCVRNHKERQRFQLIEKYLLQIVRGVTKLHVKHGFELHIFAMKDSNLIYVSGVKTEGETIWHQVFIDKFLLQQQ